MTTDVSCPDLPPRALLKASTQLALLFLAGALGGAILGALLIHLAELSPATVIERSTRHIAQVKRVIDWASGIPLGEAMVLFCNNFAVSMLGLAFLLLPRLLDPDRVHRFPALLRRFLRADAQIAGRISLPLPGYASIADPVLREVFVFLRIFPALVAIVNGAYVGIISYVIHIGAGGLTGLAWSVLLLLPHGLPELGALFLCHGVPLAAYTMLATRLRAGDIAGVFAALHALARSRSVERVVWIALPLLMTAALIEAYVTEPLCLWLRAVLATGG